MEIDEILGEFHTLLILQKAKNTTHSLVKQEIDWIVHEISKKNKGILMDFLRLHCENWQKVLAYATEKLILKKYNKRG
jgi:hypothetical protein